MLFSDKYRLSPEEIRRETVVLIGQLLGVGASVNKGIFVSTEKTPASDTQVTLTFRGTRRSFVIEERSLYWPLDDISRNYIFPVAWELAIPQIAPEVLNYWSA